MSTAGGDLAPLTESELDDLRSAAMADDVAIDIEKMRLWTAEQATAFFESGGTEEPADTAAVSPQPSVASTSPLGRKPRIALLHGTACNAAIFRIQLGQLMRPLKEVADLFFIDGSLEVDPTTEQAVTMRKFFGEKQTYMEYARATEDHRGWRTYSLLAEAIQHIEKELANLPGGGGADALFCFSQGSNLGTILAARASLGAAGAPPPFRCVVLLSPTLPGYTSQLPELFAAPLSTPALVLHCKEDTTIRDGPVELGKLWSPEAFTPLEHSGPGHRPLPSAKEDHAMVAQAITAFIAKNCPQK